MTFQTVVSVLLGEEASLSSDERAIVMGTTPKVSKKGPELRAKDLIVAFLMPTLVAKSLVYYFGHNFLAIREKVMAMAWLSQFFLPQ